MTVIYTIWINTSDLTNHLYGRKRSRPTVQTLYVYKVNLIAVTVLYII